MTERRLTGPCVAVLMVISAFAGAWWFHAKPQTDPALQKEIACLQGGGEWGKGPSIALRCSRPSDVSGAAAVVPLVSASPTRAPLYPDGEEVTRLTLAIADKDRPGHVTGVADVQFVQHAQGCTADPPVAAVATVQYDDAPDGFYFFCQGLYGGWDYYGNTYPPYGE